MDNDDIIDAVNRLIETSKDGEDGFKTSAEHVQGADLRELFTNRAVQCRQAVSELQAVVSQLGGKAEDSGSTTGALHRGWVALKGSLAGHSDLSMLEELERGEDVALERYRTALEGDLPSSVRSLVERQYEGVKRNHAQVRALRDQARALAA